MSGEQLTKPSEILSAAADLIEQPGRWTQGAFARTQHKIATEALDESAVCFCASGAIYRASGKRTSTALRTIDAASEVARRHGASNIADFNDTASTALEVSGLLRKAAQKAREQGQ
jgi:hypothetical protein